MGLMARVTEHAGIVIRGSDLREIARLGGVFQVAPDAKRGHIGERGLGGDGVAAIGVFGLRAVAGFAGNMRVFPGGARLRLIGVTKHALRLAGEGHGPRPKQIEGRGAVVPVLAESLGDHGLANQHEDPKRGHEDKRWA